MSSTPLTGSCVSPGSVVLLGPHSNSPGGQVPPLEQTVCWPHVGLLLLEVREMSPCDKEGEKTTTSTIPMSPQEMLWETRTETRYS
jgi:hypothetical protein